MSDRTVRILFIASLALGLLLRLLFVPTEGFPTDVGTFQAWADRMREVGPGRFYAPDYFSDYPPGFLYVLWLVATVLGGMPRLIAKAMSIPFDLAIALALYVIVARVARERAAAAASALYFLNPALVLAGTYWGQVDAAGALPLLIAVVALAHGRWSTAGALGALAFMVKPQFGIAVALVLAAAAFDLVLNRRWLPLARASLAAIATVVGLALPFRMTLTGTNGLVDLVRSASETYQYSTLYAFNVWAVLSDFWRPDEERLLFGLSMTWWGVVLFGLGVIGTLVVLWRGAPRGRRWGDAPARDLGLALAIAALLVLAFYFLPTRVHERYLFPFFALAAPLAALHRRAFWAYLGLATFFFLSVFYAFTRYPQTNTHPPDFLEATLYQRTGTQVLSLAGMAVALALAWWWGRGEARDVVAEEAGPAPAPATAVLAATVPEPLRPGGRLVRRDLVVALIFALLVLITRAYRLDWPRDMYFDEVYHARTAMEMLAAREYYEWTHPHLAKEIMAASVALFSDIRPIGATGDPSEVGSYAADGDGSRAYARGSVVTVVDASGARRDIGIASGDVGQLAVDETTVYAATGRELDAFPRALAPSDATVPSVTFPADVRALALGSERVFVATTDGVVVLTRELQRERELPLTDVIALAPMSDKTVFYAASADGSVRSVNFTTGQTERTWSVGARVATLTVLPNGCPSERAPEDRCDHLFLGDAAVAVLHSYDLETGDLQHVPLENGRTRPYAGAPLAVALDPLTRMVWVLGPDGLATVEPHGTSAFALARAAAGARFLGIDPANDAVIVAGGGVPAERIEAGRIAFSWRLPGVVAGAILAFFLYLLVRRLFASPLVAYATGALVLVDGAMFAQSRIGMNDVYTASGIVAGWYFVVAALQPGARRPAGSLLLAGLALGLALAAKWAAGPAILAVGLISLVATLRAFVDGRPGTGGPLDLLAWRGANAAYLALCFVAVPIAIYLASYLPWFGLGHDIFFTGPQGQWSLIDLQKQMFGYHSGLTSPHPAGSPWWAWPLDLKPVYWEYESAGADLSTYIYDAGNLVTWWAAIPAMAWLAWTALRTRAWHLGLVVLAFATQYVEWVPVSRVLFQYHFFTALPFYLVGLAAGLTTLWSRADRRGVADGVYFVAVFAAGIVVLAVVLPVVELLVAVPIWVFLGAAAIVLYGLDPRHRPRLAGALVAGVVVGGVLWFVWFYPWLSALPVHGTFAKYYFWLPTWQYGCQFYPSFRCG